MNTPALKLYLVPGRSSIFPHILLHYCDLPFDPVVVSGEQIQSEDYINPNRQVPVLVVDGAPVTENPAIALAISHLAPNKQLFGATYMVQVRVCEWLAWIAGPLHAQVWAPYVRPFRFTTEQSSEATAAIKEAARLKCAERFATLEERLHATGPWALGEEFTAVDAYVFVFYRFAARIMNLDVGTLYPKWSRVVSNLKGLEGVKQALRFEDQASAKQ